MSWWLILLPFIGAFTGFLAGSIAIKLFLHAKRQQQLALQVGKMVSNDLLSFADIEQKITSPENFNKIRPVVETHVDEFLRKRLPEAFPMIGAFIGERTISELKVLFMKELETIFPAVMQAYLKNLQQEFNLEQIIVTKMASLSADRHSVLNQVMAKQFRLAGAFGAALGFIKGLVLSLLTIIAY